MTRMMLMVTAALLAGSLACSKEPAAAPAKSASGTPAATPATAKPASGTPAAAPAAAATAAMAKPINANCPIGGKPIKADGGTTTFKGHTIGFCCPDCPPEFNKLDDAGKIAALEKNGTKLPQ